MVIGQLDRAAGLAGPGHAVKQDPALLALGGERRARSGHRRDTADEVLRLARKVGQPSILCSKAARGRLGGTSRRSAALRPKQRRRRRPKARPPTAPATSFAEARSASLAAGSASGGTARRRARGPAPSRTRPRPRSASPRPRNRASRTSARATVGAAFRLLTLRGGWLGLRWRHLPRGLDAKPGQGLLDAGGRRQTGARAPPA